MNEMLAPPASAQRDRSERQVRAPRGEPSTTPNALAASTSVGRPVLPSRRDEQAADDRADAHRRGHEAVAGRADVQPLLAITGSETWNSYASAPASAIIASGTPSSGLRLT